jgi:ABC-type antimicrobial peptide transport system permease subunit
MTSYSLNSLRRRKSRTGLTITGVVLAIAFMVTMFSIGIGVTNSAESLFEEVGVDIFVQAENTTFFSMGGGFEGGRNISKDIFEHGLVRGALPRYVKGMVVSNEEIKENLLQFSAKAANITDPEELEKITKEFGKHLKAMREKSTRVDGIVPKLMGEIGGIKNEGDFPHRDDPFYNDGGYDGEFTHEVAINKAMSKKFNLELGSRIYLSPSLPKSSADIPGWYNNSTHFEVISILDISWEAANLLTCYVHLSELQFIVEDKRDTVHQILVDTLNPNDANKVKKWILDKYDLEAFTTEDILEEIDKFSEVFKGFGDAIIGLTMFIAVLFTATIMIISVRERTVEFAALRAMGFSKKTIYRFIVEEALIIYVIGFIFGLIIGSAGAVYLDNILVDMASEDGSLPSGFHFTSITPLLIIEVASIAVLIGLACGLVAGYRTIKLNIANTLKQE